MNKTINAYYSLFYALKGFFTINQRENESVEDYFRRFEAAQYFIVLSNGSVTDLSKLLAAEQKIAGTATEAMVP